jgi:two-component system sensor histidine kinase UhpB
MSLFMRVLLANAAVLAIATLLLLFTPIEISYPVTSTQATILVTGFLVSVILNMLLLRGVIAPLRRLTATMRSVEPLQPGRRLTVGGSDSDVAALTTAFNDMLDRLESERRESGRQALLAQEAERQRVARELHDEVGQVLTGVVLELEHAAARACADDAGQIASARESVRRSLDDVRRIARELRPEVLDDLGLQSALRSLCTQAAAHRELRVEREIELDTAVSPEVELVVYRVAQESLTNVMRHAGASEVLVALRDVDGALRLVVRDDGRGLPAGADLTGTGIAGMQERALHIGARLTVSPVATGGTEVRLDVPLPGGAA